MKNLKKAMALLLALTLMLSLSITAFAAEGNILDTKGSITITGGQEGSTYDIYRIFDLASFTDETPTDPTTGSYSYKLRQANTSLTGDDATADAAKAAAWQTFAKLNTVSGKYINIDSDGYVKWVTGANQGNFAKLAAQYAAENGIAADYTVKAEAKGNDYVASQTDMRLGYYLVDSSTGALCNLNTTNPDVTITDKNKKPVIDKMVKEDGTGLWGSSNDADVLQNVDFKTFITVESGAENYVLHDIMDQHLELVPGSVKLWSDDKGTIAVPESSYTVIENPTAHKMAHETTDTQCTFEVVIHNDYLATLDTPQLLAVTYTAKLTKGAASNLAHLNKTILQYGDDLWTNYDQTETKTWDLTVFKYGKGGTPLSGAEFRFARGNDATTDIPDDAEYAVFEIVDMVEVSDGQGGTTLVPATDNDPIYEDATTVKELRLVEWVTDESKATHIVTPASGRFHIVGLDSDVYYMREMKAPNGYELLADRYTVEVDTTGVVKYNTKLAADNVIPVENEAGGVLPSTGGSGTTMLYIIGGLLTLGAAVLLITKRRMALDI